MNSASPVVLNCAYAHVCTTVRHRGALGRAGISFQTHLQPLVESKVSCVESILWTAVRASAKLCSSLSWRLGARRKEEEEEDEGAALEPGRPTDNASRQAGCNASRPSRPGVACHSALPLGALCAPEILLKGFGQRENKLFKSIVVTLESN